MTTIYKACILSCILLISIDLTAQKDYTYENYFMYEHLLFPAATGSNYYPVLGVTFNKQWARLESSPQTFIIGGNFRLGQFDFYNPKMFLNKSGYLGKERMGFGFAYVNDINGPLQANSFTLSYAYHLPFEIFTLSMGMDMSCNSVKINYTELSPNDPYDPNLVDNGEKNIFPQSGVGIQITNELFFVSLSAKNLLPNNYVVEKGFNRESADYYAYSGFTVRMDRLFTIEPSAVFMKCNGFPYTWDINTKLYYKSNNWTSLSYQSSGKLSMKVMVQVSSFFDFGYGYEFFIKNSATNTASGHNFYLGRNFGLRNVHGIRKNVKQSFL
jgi:type IX secretion system PorP/SprF family membrane protein